MMIDDDEMWDVINEIPRRKSSKAPSQIVSKQPRLAIAFGQERTGAAE